MQPCYSCRSPHLCNETGYCYGDRMVKQQADARVVRALERFVAEHEASGNFCEGLNAAWIEAKAALAAVEGHS
jgi:hypothetical protein